MKTNCEVTYLLLVMVIKTLLVCSFLYACNDSEVVDGDLDSESNSEFEENGAEFDEDGWLEEELDRGRPENPVGVEYPKTLWRDEVKVGNTFTLGFFPRDYFPRIPVSTMILPIVWDENSHSVFAIDSGDENNLDEYDFAVYNISEKDSSILDELYLPSIKEEGGEWQFAPASVADMLLVGDLLIWSFNKGVTYFGDSDYVLMGLLGYNVKTKEIKYLYQSLEKWGGSDGIGKLFKVTDDEIVIRKESGFYSFNIVDETMKKIPSGCKSDQEYYTACADLFDLSISRLHPFIIPNENFDGIVNFNLRFLRVTESLNGQWEMLALSDKSSEDCKMWQEYSECNTAWLPFESECCISSNRILEYKENIYVLAKNTSTFFSIDMAKGGLERKAGVTNRITDLYITPDNTPAKDAWMGGVQDWLITDDGDLLWVSPYDYSVRGIKGPLEEWVE